jgi:hypothetical protein
VGFDEDSDEKNDEIDAGDGAGNAGGGSGGGGALLARNPSVVRTEPRVPGVPKPLVMAGEDGEYWSGDKPKPKGSK